MPMVYNQYLGVDFAAYFLATAMTGDLIYEIDNVISSGTYYYPLWSSAETNAYQAVPVMNIGLIDANNVCYYNYQYLWEVMKALEVALFAVKPPTVYLLVIKSRSNREHWGRDGLRSLREQQILQQLV